MNFKAIVFDLGGVLFHINYQKTIDAFQAIGYRDFGSAYSQAKQDGLFNDFETGKISPEQFRTGLRSGIPHSVTDQELDSAWNAMLIGIPKEKIDLLKFLQTHFQLFLLSNTNEIHLKEVFRMNQAAHGFPDLKRFMNKQYYSCRMGLRKPDKQIFIHLLREQQFEPGDVLFVDDSIQHIEGARATGLQTHFHDPSLELSSFFDFLNHP